MARFFTYFDYKMSTLCDLICDVITSCVWS